MLLCENLGPRLVFKWNHLNGLKGKSLQTWIMTRGPNSTLLFVSQKGWEALDLSLTMTCISYIHHVFFFVVELNVQDSPRNTKQKYVCRVCPYSLKSPSYCTEYSCFSPLCSKLVKHSLRQTYRREAACCAACLWVAAAQLAGILVPDSDLGFLCKNWSLSSCSEVLLHNTYLDCSSPHPGTEEGRPEPVAVRLGLASTTFTPWAGLLYVCVGTSLWC